MKDQPAFPFVAKDKTGMMINTGMSLRDYFAGKALQGLLSNPKFEKQIFDSGGCKSGWVETSAWAFADEMLKARKINRSE